MRLATCLLLGYATGMASTTRVGPIGGGAPVRGSGQYRVRPQHGVSRVPLRLRRTQRTQMSASVIAASVGGTLAGGLHALTGPDHVACVLPACVGRRWFSAMYTGAYWGLGHGIGAVLVGAVGYALKGVLNLDAIAQWAEVFVGLSILFIGIMGVREASEWIEEAENTPGAYGSQFNVNGSVTSPSSASSLLTGIVHGCSGSGHLLGVIPALTMPTLRCASAYLLMFGLGALPALAANHAYRAEASGVPPGTMGAMSLFTAAVGELSVRMGETLDRPDIPARCAAAAGLRNP